MEPSILDRWLAAVLATPGLTAIRDPALARAMLCDDALRGTEIVNDTGTGRRRRVGRRHARNPAGGSAARSRRNAARGGAPQVPLPGDVAEGDPQPRGRLGACGGAAAGAIRRRSGEGAGASADRRGVVPPARPRWRARRPLGRGGRRARAGRRGCGEDRRSARAGARGLLAIRKTGPTPPGFPRRTGVAKKRPLA